MERCAEVGAPFEAIGQAIFRPIFTLPFSEPISCGFFFGAQERPDARIGGFVEVWLPKTRNDVLDEETR